MDEYYDKIAKGYNELHAEEQKKKLAIIKKYIQPEKSDLLLDVGCGTGVSSDWDCKVIGIDPSVELIKQNPRNKAAAKGEFLPFKDDSFDYVVSLTAIQNFSDIEKGVKEIKRVARGRIAITTLKKIKKIGQIKEAIKNNFNIIEEIEEEKDIIFILE